MLLMLVALDQSSSIVVQLVTYTVGSALLYFTSVWRASFRYACRLGLSLADRAVGFGGGQLGEVTQARVPPKLKTPRIWPTLFGEWPKIKYKNKNIKKEKSPASGPWFTMVSPVGP